VLGADFRFELPVGALVQVGRLFLLLCGRAGRGPAAASGRSQCGRICAMRTVTGLDELKQAAGENLGTSDWHEVTQGAIDAFADVTGDHQWIHVDTERAKDTPFGGTIAHGYYTLSLAPMFMEQTFALEGFAFAVNYGLNRVRFPAPLPVGAKVRMRAELASAEDIPGGLQITTRATFETEGGEKPVCVGESVGRALPDG